MLQRTNSQTVSTNTVANNKVRILIVEDELHLLKNLRRALEPMQAYWAMTFCKNGREALDHLANNVCDIIVTDLSMPGMDGIQLLQEVVKRSPQSIRMLMVEQRERERILRSICLTHQCLIKPCDANGIYSAVKRVLTLRSQLSTPALNRIVARTGVLPSIPAVYAKLVSMLNDSDVSMNDIGALIEQDPGMSAKVLQLVNSAFFGVRNRVSSVTQAVSMLGINVIKSLLAWFHLAAKFQGTEMAGFSLSQLQKHSMLTARFAQAICVEFGLDHLDAEEAFMAGLLHDVGLLIMAQAFPAQFGMIMRGPFDKKIGYTGEEQITFGTTHAEVGGYLLSLWGLRDQVVEACLYHHRPAQQPEMAMNITTAVYLANIFAHNLGKDTPMQIDENFINRIGSRLDLEKIQKICSEAAQSMG